MKPRPQLAGYTRREYAEEQGDGGTRPGAADDHSGTGSGGQVGSVLVRPPGGRHLRRLAEPPEHRRRPGRLYVRLPVRRLRHRLPVLDLAAAAADPDVLAA